MSQIQLHNDIEQGSEEWLKLRLGKITGSCFSKLLGTKAAREKYLYSRANEIVTGCIEKTKAFYSEDVQRGHEYEPIARNEYRFNNFKVTDVDEVGLVQLNDYIACSPDGLVGEDGMIEIKSPNPNNYFRQVVEISQKGVEAISNEHRWQMQFNLFVCSRKWCDYVLYNDEHATKGSGLFIFRVNYDSEMQKLITETIDKCIPMIKEYVNQYNKIFKLGE